MNKVYFFTGAGISAESGISTFRDSNGLWENNKIEEICNFNTWEQNKDKVFKFYSERRMQLSTVKPNKAHIAIAELQKKYGEDRVIIITQNVDDLFERAGCSNVLHLHGNLKEIKCVNCDYIEDIGYSDYDNFICPNCGKESLKPNIIFFNEYTPNYHFMKRHFRESTNEDIFVVIGTLGNVIAIDRELDFIFAKYKILNNLEESPYINNSKFDFTFFEPATQAIDSIVKIVNNNMK